MRVLLTGGTGFIGTALTEALLANGAEVTILSRKSRGDRSRCRFIQSLDEIAATEQIDAVINLAGASLAARRWTAAYKHEIVASRMDTTRQVARSVGAARSSARSAAECQRYRLLRTSR